MKIFSKTKSLCPLCKKLLEAEIFEEKGSMFMKKNCPNHGEFKVKIAKYAWFYKGLNKFYDNLYKNKKNFIPNPLYYSIRITQKCNLSCPICFIRTQRSSSEDEDISLEEFKNKLDKIKNKKVTIHLTGGEPTLREDLIEIISLIKKSGNIAGLYTNGVIISKNTEYLKKLKKNGLKSVYIWVDTIENGEIYKTTRGEDFRELNKKTLGNLEKLKMPTKIIMVAIKSLNEDEINPLFKLVKENNFITTLWIRGYNYLGTPGFSMNNEFLIDELIETAAQNSGGLFTLIDAYYFQKLWIALLAIKNSSACYMGQLIITPRNKCKSAMDTFRFEKFEKVFDEFEKIWQEDENRASQFFYFNYYRTLLKNPPLFYFFQKLTNPKYGSLNVFSRFYFATRISTSANLLNCDLNRIRRQCCYFSLNCDPLKKIPRCYEVLSYSP